MNKYHGTVKEFLEAGHRFVEGDVYTEHSVEFESVANVEQANKIQPQDDYRYVVYAACLNKELGPEYELVNCGFTSVEQPIKELFNGAKLYDANGCHVYLNDTDNSLSICSDGSYISYDIVYRRVPVRIKTAVYPMPETKEPERGSEYFAVNVDGSVCDLEWTGEVFDLRLLAAGNVFLKREHAQAKADAQAVEVES